MTIFANLQSRIARRSNTITQEEANLIQMKVRLSTYIDTALIQTKLSNLRADQHLDKQLKRVLLVSMQNQKTLNRLFP